MQETIKSLKELVEFWSELADKRRMQLDMARKTLKSIADYSEHADNDCCGGLAESTLHDIEELEKWENFFNKRSEK